MLVKELIASPNVQSTGKKKSRRAPKNPTAQTSTLGSRGGVFIAFNSVLVNPGPSKKDPSCGSSIRNVVEEAAEFSHLRRYRGAMSGEDEQDVDEDEGMGGAGRGTVGGGKAGAVWRTMRRDLGFGQAK
jgi:hypothetical protein